MQFGKKKPMINVCSKQNEKKNDQTFDKSLMREEKLYSIFQKFILHYILPCEGGNPEWENSK